MFQQGATSDLWFENHPKQDGARNWQDPKLPKKYQKVQCADRWAKPSAKLLPNNELIHSKLGVSVMKRCAPIIPFHYNPSCRCGVLHFCRWTARFLLTRVAAWEAAANMKCRSSCQNPSNAFLKAPGFKSWSKMVFWNDILVGFMVCAARFKC